MRAFTSLLLAATALASPMLEKRGCAQMPSRVDPDIRDTVYRTAKAMGANDKAMLATMSAAITESLVNNLRCGDKDSLGIFQQRPSMGWGSAAELNDPVYATKAFVKVLLPLEAKHPEANAGELAQMVQNAEAGNQYTKNLDYARQLLSEAAKSVGDDKPAPKPEPEEPKPAPKPSPTKTAEPKPKPTKVQPAANVASSPKPKAAEAAPSVLPAPAAGDCTKTYTPKAGDNCYKLADMHRIKLSQLYAWNPQIDAECHNLQVNKAYCVARA
ncbi:hypothetical protein AURDEDRAFT_111750 [Auricularia subglabra TFB-10046 SS5]|nr:hypothetical protein AURDEDRAFT_111750 [Auricularia subglabra TFB-10046 SS5]